MAGRVMKWDNCTNEDLLNLLRNKQEELGRKVTVKDLGNKNNMPSPSYFFKRFETWSLNKILEMANLKIDNVQKMPIEESIEKLKQHYKTLGKIPTREDFESLNLKPYYDYYRRNFGSYEHACYLAGLINKKPLNQQERIDKSIEELKNIANNLNKCPTVKEYDSMRIDGLVRRNLEKHLDKSWNDICLTYIPEYDLNIDRNITKEDIRLDIDYVVSKLGKTPTYKEYLKHSRRGYSLNAFDTAVGLTYNKTLIEFGYEPVGVSTLIRTEDEMLYLFEKLFMELKRVPYLRDLEDCEYTPTYSTYTKYFGSIENVCRLLDIDYKKHYKGAGAGKIGYDKLGQLCKSIAEKDISNYFIDNNIKFMKEIPYSDIIVNNKEGNSRRLDWTIFINNNKYFVEYFGMYDRNPRGSIGRKYSNKTKKKIKDLYKAGVNDNCIFIFPDDIKNKTLDEIFSKYIDVDKSKQQKIS